nr:MAG TPA: hypothetical protein [Caudoviricetes sp.]
MCLFTIFQKKSFLKNQYITLFFVFLLKINSFFCVDNNTNFV